LPGAAPKSKVPEHFLSVSQNLSVLKIGDWASGAHFVVACSKPKNCRVFSSKPSKSARILYFSYAFTNVNEHLWILFLWPTRALFAENAWSQMSHLKVFFPRWTPFEWHSKLALLYEEKSHKLQLYLVSFLCTVFTCSLRVPFRE
jgi:hypothetical protein